MKLRLWYTFAWDPNQLVIWSIRPTTYPAQVRLESVQVTSDDSGLTYWLTITNNGAGAAAFEAKFYYHTIVDEGNWQSLGPNHMSGCMTQVAIDPNDSDRIFALGQGGGLWLLDSVSGYPSVTWTPLSDQHASLFGFAFAIAPSNSSIIYLAEGSNLIQSADGGNTWASASNIPLWANGGDPWSHTARRIVVDPQNPDRVLVASDTGLWITTTGPAGWSALLSGDITDVAIDPDDSDVIYVGQRNVGVLKSSDGGSTWDTILAWSSVQNPQIFMIKISLGLLGDPDNRTIAAKLDQTVFVNNSSGNGSWSSSVLPADPWGKVQYDWDNVIAVDPFDNSVILAGTQHALCRTADGGNSWAPVISYYAPHEDQQSVAFDPNQQGVVYVSNDGGVFRSTDDGQTWMSGSSWKLE